MKVLETKIMKGPNYWSNFHHNLIVIKLDIGDLENRPSNKIEGFATRLESLMPTLYQHRCSRDCEGGFLERVKEGTWIGHIIEHIALELQCLAGMECGFGRTRTAHREGVYNIIINYQIESAGLYAAQAAIVIAEKLVAGLPCDLAADVAELQRIKAREGFGPSTQSIINEAVKRNIPFRSMEKGSLILLGQGVHQKLIRASMTCATSSYGVDLAHDKEDTKQMLSKAYIPVPAGEIIVTEEGLTSYIEENGFPLVIKPVDANHGRGITTNITGLQQALEAFKLATAVSKEVLAEKFVQGDDYRLLVINYKLVAAAKRTPAMVMGDGIRSIQQLIDQTNEDPARGEGHEKTMTAIKVDAVTENILRNKGVSLDHVLPIGEILFLKDTANLSTGGTATDVTEQLHPYNVFMAERIARIMKLDICGIDIISSDISSPLNGINGAVIEVNACPGFRMHLNPSKGLARNVAEPVLDMLFPSGKPSRIPIVAVTGTNGKTTTTRLAAHLAKVAGHKVGYITTDGIYIQDHPIHFGDDTGSQSAAVVLSDPTVDFAVLECARGGILRSGLGFDHCDISIITNVSEDHLGLKDINSLEEMARVKSVVAQSTFETGFSILNADDDLVYHMKDDLYCNIALFSVDANNVRIKKHCASGGLAAVIEKGFVTVCKGEWKIRVSKVEQIPLTLGGRAQSMIKNVLPAVLAGIIRNFRIEDIRDALASFIPSPEQTPGRMNIFKFREFELMIDYAHNPAGFKELRWFLDKIKSAKKVGVITGVGDRRDEDITALGELAGEMFNEIVIKHDEDLRGRCREEITALLVKGIHKITSSPVINVVSNELAAIQFAMEHAGKGAFIVVCTEDVQNCLKFVKEKLRLEKENYKVFDPILSQK